MSVNNALLEYERQRLAARRWNDHLREESAGGMVRLATKFGQRLTHRFNYKDDELGGKAKQMIDAYYTLVEDFDLPVYAIDVLPQRAVADAMESFDTNLQWGAIKPPSPAGMMWFTEPVEYVRNDGHVEGCKIIVWYPGNRDAKVDGWPEGGSTVFVVVNHCPEEVEMDIPYFPRNAIVWPHSSPMSECRSADDNESVSPYRIMAYVMGLWAFMEQRIALATVQRASRGVRKQVESRGMLEVPELKIVKLRAVEQRVYERAEAEGREWAHRWIVRGHWRNQWYRSEGVHRPIWISPYVKGPDGMPLIGSRKVFDVRR